MFQGSVEPAPRGRSTGNAWIRLRVPVGAGTMPILQIPMERLMFPSAAIAHPQDIRTRYTFDTSNRIPATPNTTARHASIARRPRTYSRRAPSIENTSA